MAKYKEIIEAHFSCKVNIGWDSNGYDTYEEISTADGYEIFVHMPAGQWKNVFPESDVYYYIDDMGDAIREHIKSSGNFSVSEYIAEELELIDPDGSFWEDMCEEENLLEETAE